MKRLLAALLIVALVNGAEGANTVWLANTNNPAGSVNPGTVDVYFHSDVGFSSLSINFTCADLPGVRMTNFVSSNLGGFPTYSFGAQGGPELPILTGIDFYSGKVQGTYKLFSFNLAGSYGTTVFGNAFMLDEFGNDLPLYPIGVPNPGISCPEHPNAVPLFQIVPEPATLGLLFLGGMIMLRRNRPRY